METALIQALTTTLGGVAAVAGVVFFFAFVRFLLQRAERYAKKTPTPIDDILIEDAQKAWDEAEKKVGKK